MKGMLKDFSNLLLVVLCDYVLGEAEYLLLGEPGHVALSNHTVSVAFGDFDRGNGTLRNVSVLLLEATTNRTVTTKHLLTNQSQGTLEFECFHFQEAGDYWFRMTPSSSDNGTVAPGRGTSALLKVEWPVFRVDVNRTPDAAEGTFQVGLFTAQPLCPFPGAQPHILVDVVVTDRLPEARTSVGRALESRTSRSTALRQGQWVQFGCVPVGPQAYVTVVLKLRGRDSVMTSTGPIDLAQKFGYTLVTGPEVTCESAVEVTLVPPPCVLVQGVVAVSREAPRRPGEGAVRLAQHSLGPGERRTAFNCTLFDVGKHKYCFDFSFASRSRLPTKEECVLIQRNVAMQPSSPTPLPPQGPVKPNNMVTVTGISLCLFIIVATVLVTLWRKFGRAPRCSAPTRHSSIHSPGGRKHSDEENICEEPSEPPGSFSDAGDGPCGSPGDLSIPLTSRRSGAPGPEDDASGSESFQSNAQKIIPPLFSYRLAQQQLKEMKKKGLTETTKVYHVSQSPLTDTALDAPAGAGPAPAGGPAPLDSENPEEVAAAANKFRIKAPFLEPPAGGAAGDRALARLDVSVAQAGCAISPSQTLIRKSQLRHAGSRGGPSGRSHPRGAHFRRTASFHEAKQARPFRERSLSALTPQQAPTYSSRARPWEPAGDRGRPPSRGPHPGPEKPELCHGAGGASGLGGPFAKAHTLALPSRKAELGDRPAGMERTEPHRARRGPSPSHRSVSRKQPSPTSPKESSPRASPLSPPLPPARKDKCQSFPAHPEFAFYDNTSFGLTEAEQRMLDLPGYFGSNEEDETTSTLSVEKLVI
ncbi:thrombospondin type-1 domain-containing protein 1 [Echinops telfairi]|uniref:Thrombospondin type-1 domain-containing protein 1 n=1 Tax=Echinops telfairi TaxID=9371 RepID=A0ABM0IZ69_ECHTE|nr:thrombospondin type-1 domain-containing protein 1 [Echinops telfairi]